MWKNYNLFYTQILKSDIGLCFMSKNVHQIPRVYKTSLVSTSRESLGIKKTLLSLSGIQLISNSRCHIVVSRKSIPHLKIRKGESLGAKLTLTSSYALQFLHFFIFNCLSLVDLIDLLSHNKKNLDFTFLFKSFIVFPRLTQHFNFFQKFSYLRVLFSCKGDCKNLFFFLRFLKIPIKIS